jgi:hypothetical protein
MKVLRFVVRVDAAWQVRITCAADPGFATPPRAMRRAIAAGRALPLPPEGDAPDGDAAGAALFADATGAEAAQHQRRIASRAPRGGDIERLGRFLFAALIGDEAWAAVVDKAAATPGVELIELALSWPASEAVLNRLNWELMRSAGGFLAAGGGKRVAITRLVAAAPGAPPAPPPRIPSPPRILFVAGSRLGDASIRPGAEYLAVLQELEHKGTTLRGELVLEATPRKLREAVLRVAPDVVHFVCHGDVGPDGRAYIELLPDEEGADPRRYAEQIVELVRVGERLPAAVVLSACYSASASDAREPRVITDEHTPPLAAELVAAGIPIVVGMAGRVADAACRLFTRQFGEALVSGAPIVAATEEGRRAAFAEGAAPHASADWALPTLFFAEGVPPDVRTEPPEGGGPAATVEGWVRSYGLQAIVPVFCGRWDLLDAFRVVLEGQGRPVLAVYTEREDPAKGIKFGKSHLLKELTARALRGRHVPCLLRWPPGEDPPRTALELGQKLGEAIGRTRRHIGLPPSGAPQLRLALAAAGGAALDRARLDVWIADRIEEAGASHPEVLRMALEKDLGALIADARAKHPGVLSPASRAVLLVDDVDRCDQAIDPLLHQVLGPSGLGAPEDPFPVVLAFHGGGPAQLMLKPVIERRMAGWLVRKLDAFAEGEDMLAYERLLMNPFNETLSDNAGARWALNYGLGADKTGKWERQFRKHLQGVPTMATSDRLYILADLAQEDGFVIKADDEALLRALRAGAGGR